MSYTKQDLSNAGIPLDVTIDTLYQEIRKGGLAQLPRRTMIKTVRNQYPSIVTLGDLFDFNQNSRSFSELRAGILTMAPTINAIHQANTAITIVPTVHFSSLEEGLRLFLPAYIGAKKQRAAHTKYQVKANDIYCAVLDKLFDEHSSNNSREDVAKWLRITTQNVDDKIKQAREQFHHLFFLDMTPDNISVSPDLVKLVRVFQSQFIVPGDRQEMVRLSGIKSPRLLELLALILGYTILESGIVIQSGIGGMDIARNVGKVKKILKREGLPISFDDFRILLSKEFKDVKLRDNLEQFARGYHEFEVFPDDKGKELIAVKWKYLDDLDTELVRILYDNNAWGPESAMSPSTLKAKWERLAKNSGRKDIKYLPKYRHWRFLTTKNGYAMLRWSKADYFIDGQKYISSLVYDNPSWTLKDVLAQAQKDGYSNIYPRNSLQTYYSNAQDNHTTEDALVASVRILDYTSNHVLSFQELLSAVNKKGIPVLHDALRKWIIRNDATFSYFSISGQKGRFVKLINKKAPLQTPYSSSSVPSTRVATTTTPALLNPVSRIDWNTISSTIISIVSETNQFPLLQSSIGNIYLIMKGSNTTLPNNSVFLGWLHNLDSFQNTTSWAKDGIRKNVLLSVEPFLTNFYQLKKNSDLKTDIMFDPAFFGVKAIGLGTKAAYLSSLSILPDKNHFYSSGSIEKCVIKATKTVVDARNIVIGHAEATVNLSDSDMNEQVHDALLLFLYLASKL